MGPKIINQLPSYANPLTNTDVFHINASGVDYQIPASLLSSSVSSLLGFTTFGESIVQSADAPSARSILEAEQRANLLSAITALQDTDELIISDASDSFLSKKITVANLKLALDFVQAASQAEVNAGVVADKYVAPSTLLGLFNASNLTTSGSFRLPVNSGGSFSEIIINIGNVTLTANTGANVVFDTAFSSTFLWAATSKTSNSDLGSDEASGFRNQTLTGMRVNNADNGITHTVYWMAIGI